MAFTTTDLAASPAALCRTSVEARNSCLRSLEVLERLLDLLERSIQIALFEHVKAPLLALPSARLGACHRGSNVWVIRDSGQTFNDLCSSTRGADHLYLSGCCTTPLSSSVTFKVIV